MYEGPKSLCKRIPSPLQVLKDLMSKGRQQWGYKIDEQKILIIENLSAKSSLVLVMLNKTGSTKILFISESKTI